MDKNSRLKISLTPITQDRLIEVGFEKVIEKGDDDDTFRYILRLPKNSPDPNCLCLITSYSTEYREVGVNPGQFVVELFDSGGLGTCFSMEEIELLYFVLTKSNL